jgi:type I restriction enzyme R subunit
VYRVLEGKPVPESYDPTLDDAVPAAAVTVQYSQALPPESFDLVIVDEAHRSIYGLWRGVPTR